MPTVQTPSGRTVTVRKRWYPWPPVFEEEKLESIGVSSSAAHVLSKNSIGDSLLAGFIGVLFVGLPLLLGAWVVLAVSITLIVGLSVARFLALPWRIEIVHEGFVVDGEDSEGSARTARRIEQVAELYENGTLFIPTPRAPEPPSLESNLPVAAPTLPPLEVAVEEPSRPVDSFGETDEESSSSFSLGSESPFAVTDSPWSEVGAAPAPKPQVSAPPRGPLDTPLRRALRELEEEERALAAQGVEITRASKAEEKRATPRRK